MAPLHGQVQTLGGLLLCQPLLRARDAATNRYGEGSIPEDIEGVVGQPTLPSQTSNAVLPVPCLFPLFLWDGSLGYSNAAATSETAH